MSPASSDEERSSPYVPGRYGAPCGGTDRARLDAKRCAVRVLGVTATPYVEEALRWLPSGASAQTDRPPEPRGTTARILVADDNADMRDYVSRLLSVRFQVESVGDGAAALEAASVARPTSSSAT